MVLDILSNGLNVIKSSGRARKHSVMIPTNGLFSDVVKVLHERGYVHEYREVKEDNKFHLEIRLKYDDSGEHAISDIKRISKNSNRVYWRNTGVKRIANGYATLIMTTSKGVMTGRQARALKLGGEPLCFVM
jgi:small subunit ribosomal protein S8